jgi:hypothetical protein
VAQKGGKGVSVHTEAELSGHSMVNGDYTSQCTGPIAILRERRTGGGGGEKGRRKQVANEGPGFGLECHRISLQPHKKLENRGENPQKILKVKNFKGLA